GASATPLPRMPRAVESSRRVTRRHQEEGCSRGKQWSPPRLEPALPAEEDELSERGADDQAPRPPVAEAPADLRDVVEVLAVEADDEGGDEEQRRDHGQALHDLVLVVRDLRLEVVADAGDEVA